MPQPPLAQGVTTAAVGTRLPTPTLDRLDRLAAARGVRRSDLVREAIAALLDQEGNAAA